MKTFTVILEYCGGSETDYLFDRLRMWNPGSQIEVLDNASPQNRCSCITAQNPVNTYIGGGIIDCCRLAEAAKCDNLFFVANDIDPITPIVVAQFEAAFAHDPSLVQLSASLTHDSSPHAAVYPWMVAQPSQKTRRAPHSDLLCCIIRNSFLSSFGGFPLSRGGWGYDWELAHQALLQRFRIAVADWCVVKHEDKLSLDNEHMGVKRSRHREMLNIYQSRYPNQEFAIQRTVAEYWSRGVIQMGD